MRRILWLCAASAAGAYLPDLGTSPSEAMNGRSFNHAVPVIVDGTEHRGCGRRLEGGP
jgi:hypothetical protein